MKASNVVSLNGDMTHEAAIAHHLAVLSAEQRETVLTECVVLFRTRDDDGVGFNVTVGNDTAAVIGLLEVIKSCLIMRELTDL